MQSLDGFSHHRVHLKARWGQAVFDWQLLATTEYTATLHSTSAGTPLRPGFHFFGSGVQQGVQARWSISDTARLENGAAGLQQGSLEVQNIGLLQPGQRFQLRDTAFAQMRVGSRFDAGHAEAFVVDPFSFEQPPAQLQIDGLTLPVPVGAVPKPAAAALLLIGLAGWWAWATLAARRASGILRVVPCPGSFRPMPSRPRWPSRPTWSGRASGRPSRC